MSDLLERLPSLFDEIHKIAGEFTLDPNVATQTLADAAKVRPRGPHPALNLEHAKTAETDVALLLRALHR
jgi:hypothetical protein